MDIDRYKDIVDLNSEFNQINITAFIPSPRNEDYKRGYITRYFVQKANDSNSFIYEVSKENYSLYVTNSFLSSVQLDWRITGEDVEIKKSNSESIRLASKKLNKLQLYLPNLLQFRKK